MHNWLKISHNQHTGRLHKHEHTSYLPLALLLVVVGFALTVASVAALPHPGPQANSVGLTGTMPGPAPTVAAVITTPNPQQHFGVSPITVSGTCPKDTLVEIYKNNIFAGSSICSDSGNFSLKIDLLIGRNSLVARVYNSLSQPGPDSVPVIVYYDALPDQADPLSNLSLSGAQLILNTNAVYRGVFPGQELSMPIDILGGTPPYAVNVEWGDANNKIIPRNNNLTFSAKHTYQKPGIYQITLQATDAQDRTAFLMVAAIVNGQPAAAATTGGSNTAAENSLLALWPLYTSAAAVVISFWLGERREKYILTNLTMRWQPRSHAAH